jgi:hypothetical protein
MTSFKKLAALFSWVAACSTPTTDVVDAWWCNEAGCYQEQVNCQRAAPDDPCIKRPAGEVWCRVVWSGSSEARSCYASSELCEAESTTPDQAGGTTGQACRRQGRD